MKVIWTVMVLLVLGAVAVVAAPRAGDSLAPAPKATPPAVPARPDVAVAPEQGSRLQPESPATATPVDARESIAEPVIAPQAPDQPVAAAPAPIVASAAEALPAAPSEVGSGGDGGDGGDGGGGGGGAESDLTLDDALAEAGAPVEHAAEPTGAAPPSSEKAENPDPGGAESAPQPPAEVAPAVETAAAPGPTAEPAAVDPAPEALPASPEQDSVGPEAVAPSPAPVPVDPSNDAQNPGGEEVSDQSEVVPEPGSGEIVFNPAAAPAVTAAPPPAPEVAGPPVSGVVVREDGSLLIDGRYVIKGDGTKEKPYQVPWEVLIAVSKNYQPRLGKKDLPSWAAAINDKWVVVTGFLLFPVLSDSTDDVLVMLNQWDGCCIGVPPTPFDAIEVKLASATDASSHRLVNYANITGRFRVDPYLINDWLVGLYIMDDASLSSVGGIGTPGQ